VGKKQNDRKTEQQNNIQDNRPGSSSEEFKSSVHLSSHQSSAFVFLRHPQRPASSRAHASHSHRTATFFRTQKSRHKKSIQEAHQSSPAAVWDRQSSHSSRQSSASFSLHQHCTSSTAISVSASQHSNIHLPSVQRIAVQGPQQSSQHLLSPAFPSLFSALGDPPENPNTTKGRKKKNSRKTRTTPRKKKKTKNHYKRRTWKRHQVSKIQGKAQSIQD
jgi:hypothetical protein